MKAVLTTPCEIIQHSFGLVFSPPSRPKVVVTVQHNGINPAAFEGIFAPIDGDWQSDLNVLPIAMELYRKSYPNVVVVWNQFPRRFVDTNRKEGPEGYVDERLKKYHKDFYAEVRRLLASANNPDDRYNYRQAILLDLHGFAKQPRYAPRGGYDIILGTYNRRTVATEQPRPGGCLRVFGIEDPRMEAVFHRDPEMKKLDFDLQIRDVMERLGLSIFCPDNEPLLAMKWKKYREEVPILHAIVEAIIKKLAVKRGMKELNYADEYDGGNLISSLWYEAQLCRPLAAIQIEINSRLREKSKRFSQGGRKKRELFIGGLAGLINEVREGVLYL